MKELLVVFLVVSGVVAEPPAPYPPSGWRPSGPSFELPPQQQKPEYLPPFNPRTVNPPLPTSSSTDDDVRVQGLPTQEQLPLFQVSPINGQQYVGPTFNSDILSLNKDFQQSQFQKQQARSGQFANQKELDTRIPVSPDANHSPDPSVPSQFAPRPTFPTEVVIAPRPRITVNIPETTVASTPYSQSAKPKLEPEQTLNQGEESPSQNPNQSDQKVSIEVTKENMQEYPPELLLSALARLQLEPRFASLQQIGQIKAPVYFQAAPEEVAARQISTGYDGPVHFAALSSILGERQNIQQNQQFVIESQRGLLRKPAFLVTEPEQPLGFVSQSPDQQLLINNQYQPLIQPQAFPQTQLQPGIVNPQTITHIQPNRNSQPKIQDTENSNDHDETEFVEEQAFQSRELQQPQQGFQPQVAYQPQLALQQPQVTQPQLVQTQQSFQPQPVQLQQVFQPQSVQPQLAYQPQSTLQPQAAYGQPQAFNQYQPQSAYQPNSQPQGVNLQQFPIQPQGIYYQPQDAFLTQAQILNIPNQDQFLQQQFIGQDLSQIARQQAFQGQGSLQSGLDINQQGNDIEQTEEQDGTDTDAGDDSSATAVATAFGSRSKPRVTPQYGAPIPRVQANPGYPAVPHYAREDVTESEVAAETTPANISKENRRNSARLRSGRQRQLFTLDQSGRLVLARN